MQSEARGGPLRGSSTRSRGYLRGARGSSRGTRGAYRARGSIHGSFEPTRGNTYAPPTSRGLFASKTWRKPAETSTQHATSNWQERYATLEESRKRERANAIRHGLIADPDKPRKLAEAITPIGTCQDMCAEFERVQRVVQKDVWKEETDPAYPASDRVPDERRMVKKFRRAAAGIEEQLPSDLRPPHILKQTCDYLFNEVIGQAEHLAQVHHFVWDRTRAIRNDLSIQQLTKPEDVRLAIECYERIARFHILSLHQLALAEKPYDKYDWQQEREQLDKALVSLMEYYEDNRGKVDLPNEVEFRAYCIIFELKNSTPDIEDRIQSWPREIAHHPRVKQARALYAAACTTNDMQGPLKPRTQHAIAQQDWHKFWRIIESSGVSYLMGCVAEIYFNSIRGTILQALMKSASAKVLVQWDIEHIQHALAFDHEEEVEEFCDRYGLAFKNVDGQLLLDFSAFPNRELPDPKATATKQSKSYLVEQKRWNRTLPAVINGLSTKEARSQGLVEEDSDEMQDIGGLDGEDGTVDVSSDDGLFVSEAQPSAPAVQPPAMFNQASTAESPFAKSSAQASTTARFGQPSASPFGPPNGTDKKPSLFAPPATATFGQPSASPFTSATPSAFGKPTASPFAAPATSAFGKPSSSPFAAPSISFGKPSASPFAPAATIEQAADTAAVVPPTATSGQRSGSPFATAAAQPTATTFGKRSASPFAPAEVLCSAPAAVPTFGKPSASPFAAADSTLGKPSAPLFAAATARTSENTPFPTSVVDKGSAQATTSEAARWSDAAKPKFSFSKPMEQVPAKASVFGAPSVLANAIAATADIKSGFDFRQPPKPETSNAPPPAKAPEVAFKFPSKISGISGSTQQASGSDLFAPVRSANEATTAPTPSSASDIAKPTAVEPVPSKSTQEHPAPRPSTSSDDNKTFAFAKLKQQQSTPTTQTEPLFPPVSQAATQPRDDNTNFAPPQAKEVASQPAPQKKEPDLNAILDQAARHLTLDEGTGLLKQFVDFALTQIVNEVQEQVYIERIEQEAAQYRASKVAERYGIYWRDLCRRRRLARLGREQRERAFRRMHEAKSQQSAAASVIGSASSASGKRARYGHSHSKVEAVDKMFQQSVNSGRWAKMAADAEKLSASHHNAPSEVADDSAQDSSNSFTRIDRNGRIVKPGSQSPASPGLNRSVGRSAGTPATTPLRNTTRTSYFRRKALGIDLDVDESPVRTKKRGFSEISAISQHASSPLSSTAMTPDTQNDMIVPGQALAKVRKSVAEDDALFARVRALKQILAEETSFYREEIAKAQGLQSHNLDTAPYESPSLERARFEARERRAQENGADIPAYRLRESKFVPRDSYIDSVQAARKVIEARSAAASRPESRMTDYSPEAAVMHGANGIKSGHEDDLPILDTTAQHGAEPLVQAGLLAQEHSKLFSNGSHSLSHQSPEQVVQGTSAPSSFGSFVTTSQSQAQLRPSIGHEFTIPPTQIPASLSASFQSSRAYDDDDAVHQAALQEMVGSQIAETWQTFGTQGPKNAFSLVNDNDIEQNDQHANGDASVASESVSDQDVGYSHTNPFALLDYADDEEHDAEAQSEEDPEEEFDSNNGQATEGRLVVQDEEEDSEDGSKEDPSEVSDHDNGDATQRRFVEGEDDEDEMGWGDDENADGEMEDYSDEEEFEEDEDEEDDDQQSSHHLMPRQMQQRPAPNQALQAIGHNEDDAIELSD